MATGVGQLPATIVYSYVGGMLTGGAEASGLTGLADPVCSVGTDFYGEKDLHGQTE